MGFRFRRSVTIAPGLKINANKKSIGVSVGGRGAHVSVNSSGRVSSTSSIPGTGMSWSQSSSSSRHKRKAAKNKYSYLDDTNDTDYEYSEEVQAIFQKIDWERQNGRSLLCRPEPDSFPGIMVRLCTILVLVFCAVILYSLVHREFLAFFFFCLLLFVVALTAAMLPRFFPYSFVDQDKIATRRYKLTNISLTNGDSCAEILNKIKLGQPPFEDIDTIELSDSISEQEGYFILVDGHVVGRVEDALTADMQKYKKYALGLGQLYVGGDAEGINGEYVPIYSYITIDYDPKINANR